MVVMTMLMVMMMSVVRATFGCSGQLATQKAGDEFLHQHARLAGAHIDALPRKEVKRSSANAASDHGIYALSVQPARKESRCVGRSCDRPGGQDVLALAVSFDKRELGAAAEMAVEPAVLSGNGDPDD